jgi:transcription elongation factor Elf1
MGAKDVNCHKCGEKNIVDIESIETNKKCEIEFICSICGSLNILSIDPNVIDSIEVLFGKPPQGFEWILPSGKIMPIIGDPIYISASGEYLSRRTYIERYKLDPEIAYEYMRRMQNKLKTNEISNKSSQRNLADIKLNLENINKIEILCENCGKLCQLKL